MSHSIMQEQRNCAGIGHVQLNLCRPDNRKSCAACCGLYNVPDGTRPTLAAKLEKRTSLFWATLRTVPALEAYQNFIRNQENASALDPVIHVCEFTGFLDLDHKIVGCLIHPSAPGNDGIDLRGLCYYGSMACKCFLCPAWSEITASHRELLLDLLDDWHLYGLVMTDPGFIHSLFRLLEINLGEPVASEHLYKTPACEIFKSMLAWKDSWPFNSSSNVRRSRYYFKTTGPDILRTEAEYKQYILESLEFTFGLDQTDAEALDFVQKQIEAFVRVYR
jgi:hypothetical protein